MNAVINDDYDDNAYESIQTNILILTVYKFGYISTKNKKWVKFCYYPKTNLIHPTTRFLLSKVTFKVQSVYIYNLFIQK